MKNKVPRKLKKELSKIKDWELQREYMTVTKAKRKL